MTDRRLGIEVDVSSKGDGISRINRDAKDLNETFQDFQRNLAKLSDDLAEVNRRQANLNETYHFAERQVDKFTSEVERAADSLRGLRRPFQQAEAGANETAEATTGVGYAFAQMAERAESINKIIRPINTLRFHSTQLAEAAGLIESKYSGAANSGQAFEQIADRLDLTISSLEKTIGRMNVGIETLTQNLDKQHKKATAVGETFDVLGTEIHDAGEKAYYLNQALFESSNQLEVWKNKAEIARLQAEALRHEMGNTGEETEHLGSDLNRLGQHLERIAQNMDRSGDEANRFDDQLDKLASSLDRAGDKLDDIATHTKRTGDELEKTNFKGEAMAEVFGNIVSEALEEAAQAAFDFAKESVQAFYDFDRGMREVFTLLPGASAKMREDLERDVLLLGTELGRLPEEMLPAVYNALSAGIPEDNVLSVVETASHAAKAGVAELGDTLKLGVAVLNAQVTGVSNITDVYDQLFFTVKNGVITLPEMNDVMSQVTSIAGEAGVSMQDISAAMIVMTRQGDSAAEAAELLSIMLTQLSTSGTTLASTFEQAAGKSFRQFVAEGGNLAGTMQLLQNHATRTGVALGDILGGGSPFFRDTQAARGALELTGKHLEDLVYFSQEAEKATGSMAVASAEMGEAAEQGALEAKAAYEELKIAIGEAAAVKLNPIIEDATQLAKVVSGNYENQISKQVDELIESGLSYVEVGQRVTKVLEEQSNFTGQVTGGYGAIFEQVQRLAIATGDYSKGNQELEQSLRLVLGQNVKVANGYVMMNGQVIDSIENLKALNAQHLETGAVLPEEKLNSYDRALLNHNNTAQATVAVYEETAGVYDFLDEKIDRTSKLREVETAAIQNQTYFIHDLIAAKQAEGGADETRLAAMTAYSTTLQANIEAERTAIEELKTSYSNYALNADTAAYSTTNWTNELFNAAAQQGISQEQIILLAAATGEYSDEQVEAMLKTAAMKTAVDELAREMAEGNISTQDAVAALQNFEAQLDKDFQLQFEYKDLDHAKTAADNAHSAFVRAAGNFKATFTTHNITINETQEKKGKSGGSSSNSGPTPNHLGGTFRANELMLVGDGPGGKFIPGISEYVAFDKPGTVISAADSARLFRGQATPPGIGGASPAFNEFAPADAPAARGDVNIQIIIQAQPGADLAGITEDTMREAARKAGLVE